MPLLTFSQQQAIKKISENNQGDYDQLATEVEEKELIDLLGVALLQDLQDNPANANNIKLLDGSTFEDCNGNTIKQKGVRWMLAYMNFSEYLGTSFAKDTFSGYVKKVRQDSEQLSEGAIKRLQQSNREIALTQWSLIKSFLNENSSDYPLWIVSESSQPYTPKIRGVRKTSKLVYTTRRKLCQ
jgi:hypothetical protein